MLRDKSLIPLSHQHQRALALCVRIDRAQPIPVADLESWQAEIDQHFEQEINIHFAAEEQVLFPAASRFPELVPLVKELIADHAGLRDFSSKAERRGMSGGEPAFLFPTALSSHSQRRTPVIRAPATVDACKKPGSSWGPTGRSSQRRRAILRSDEPGNEAAVRKIALSYSSCRVLNSTAASRPI